MPIREFKPDSVFDEYQKLLKYHAGKVSRQQKWDAYYDQDTAWAKSKVPGDIEIFASSLATDLVDTLADQIRTDEPVVDFNPTGLSAAARGSAVSLRRWGLLTLEHDRTNGEIDPFSQVSKDLPLRGESVIKQLHNPNIPLEPERQTFSSDKEYDEAMLEWQLTVSESPPLLPARVIDPLNILLPPNSTWPYPYLIEVQKRNAMDMWADYPAYKARAAGVINPFMAKRGLSRWTPFTSDYGRRLTDDEASDPTREVLNLHFWSESDHILVADGGVILNEIENPYKITPYAHAYSGLGRNDVRSDPSEKAIGILGKLEGEIEGDIVMRTITFALTQYYVFPRLKVPKGLADEVKRGMVQRGIIEYDPDLGINSIDWLPSPEISPAVAGFLSQTRDRIESRVSPVLSGNPGTATESGVQEAVRIGQAGTGFADLATAANKMGTQVIQIKAQIMKAMGLSATVTFDRNEEGADRDKVLNGEKGDFDHPRNFVVDFKAFDPVEDSRQQQAGLRLYEGGRAITKRTLRTQHLRSIVSDPEEEEIQEQVERAEDIFWESPEAQQFVVRTTMGEQALEAEAQAETMGEPGPLEPMMQGASALTQRPGQPGPPGLPGQTDQAGQATQANLDQLGANIGNLTGGPPAPITQGASALTERAIPPAPAGI